MNCTQCHTYPIYNQHFKLCAYCNRKRLDEKKRTGSKSSSGSVRTKKTSNIRVRIQRKDSRRKAPKSQIQKTTFRQEITERRPAVCSGCNSTTRSLTVSHTIPVSLAKHLEFEHDNVELECIECHTKWEHGTIEAKKQLYNYEQKIEYIKRVDPEYFNRKFSEL